MATFLDVTGLQYFSSVFVFLFVWLVLYAVLSWTKVLGENKFVIILVGLLFGIFVLISPLATDVVGSIAPFVAVIFVLILLMTIASKMIGGTSDTFPGIKGLLIVLIVLVIIAGVAVKIKEGIAEPDTTDLSKTMNLIFHPTFLGTVLIFGIAIFTIALLAGKTAMH